MKLYIPLFLLFLALFANEGNAQDTLDPSEYCGPGTLWSDSLQQCLPNPFVSANYDVNSDGCVNVTDLLGLLSAFGECSADGKTIYWFQNTGGWPYGTGSWLDETTEFYIQDCAIDTGYYMTSDVDFAFEFMVQNQGGLVWCLDTVLYDVMTVDSLTNVTSISQSQIPIGTISYEIGNQTAYLVIPQSFDENAFMLEQYFFETYYGQYLMLQDRRSLLIQEELYWLYGSSNTGGELNVRCGL